MKDRDKERESLLRRAEWTRSALRQLVQEHEGEGIVLGVFSCRGCGKGGFTSKQMKRHRQDCAPWRGQVALIEAGATIDELTAEVAALEGDLSILSKAAGGELAEAVRAFLKARHERGPGVRAVVDNALARMAALSGFYVLDEE
jgi:hypothetical protein